jgi:cardiolipin synthase A/B
MTGGLYAVLGFLFHLGLQVTFAIRAVMRPRREPAARMAWVVVIFVVPVLGILSYILLGEANIGRRRAERLSRALEALKPIEASWRSHAAPEAEIPLRYALLFRAGRSISGFPPVAGNTAQVMESSAATIDAMVADIDAARDHVHVLFYIWLPDTSGRKLADALIRAARRGVTVRVMADDVGARFIIRTEHWRAMGDAGVRLARALPVGNILLRLIEGRIDMRNHRKIVVIDNRVTYTGSQNAADAEFSIKARFGPWVDLMVRFEGPIALQNQHLFAADWMGHVDEDLSPLFETEPSVAPEGFPAQVIGTGPAERYSAMPEMFEALMWAARRELVITTPYYVPDEPIQAALCASARRGVATTLILPARNDSWIVAAASRSYYPDLLEAGVRIFEYEGGLLHAKTLTLDGEITLVGSANIDRRSFELNSENNVMVFDAGLTEAVRRRQESFLRRSVEVTAAGVASWPARRRLWHNTVAMIGPLL